MSTSLDQAKAVADAVLYEGYLLYPYRASADKNQVRWQFGVLMPPLFAANGSGEHVSNQTECLLEATPTATVHVRVRFLQIRARTAEQLGDNGEFAEVASIRSGEEEVTTWEEAVERDVDAVLPIAALLERERRIPFTEPRRRTVRELPAEPGQPSGRVVHTCFPITGLIRLRATRLPGPYGGIRLRVTVENTSELTGEDTSRDHALRHALISTHSLLALSGGSFLSLLEPPEWAKPAVAECENVRTWPVLVGDPTLRDVVLSSPIILYDHPSIAPESESNFFDGTEMDEMLTLRTMTLTDAEKAEARATDQRVKELLDQIDDMPPELLSRLHGTIRELRQVTARRDSIAGSVAQSAAAPEEREQADESAGAELADVTAKPAVPWWEPGADRSVNPETDRIPIAGASVGKGTRVLLKPGRQRRTDAQDMFLTGRVAIVQGVFLDVDGEHYLAVTLEDDPAADLQNAHGRYRYFGPDEVEPLPPAEADETAEVSQTAETAATAADPAAASTPRPRQSSDQAAPNEAAR